MYQGCTRAAVYFRFMVSPVLYLYAIEEATWTTVGVSITVAAL